jgi:hypothetical protein
MNYVCGDNRFEIIERYKKELISVTNIEGSPDEMAVLDNILFRFWQMGWLKEQEAVEPSFKQDEKGIFVWCCGSCGAYMYHIYDGIDKAKEYAKFCRKCGRQVKWE